jgi:hypothetical protein
MKINNPKKLYNYIISFTIVGFAALFVASATTPQYSDEPAVRSFGIFPGFGDINGLNFHERTENYLNRKLYIADAYTEGSTWANYRSTLYGLFQKNDGLFVNRKDVRPAVTVPPVVAGEGAPKFLVSQPGGPEIIRQNFIDTINGKNDENFRLLGQRLMESGQKNAIIRIASEADIAWNPYTFRSGNEDVFISAFRRVVTILRATPGNNFLIDYMGNGSFASSYTSPRTGKTTSYAEAAYPGDEYVDIIGIDVYNRQPWSNVKAKLDFTLALAKKHGKPMSIPEWGLWVDETGDDVQFIQNMYDWMNATPKTGPGRLLYNIYFYNHVQANLDRAPNSKAKVKQLFGKSVSPTALDDIYLNKTSTANPTPTPPPPSPTPAPVSLPNVNLVAGSLKTIPASPVAGEEVTFQVTIRNDGAGATPAGVKHGVSFWIGGNNVAWSDNSTTSLAPGATRVLTSNGGLDGNATWTATQGTSTITAKWDDVFRITESDNIKSELQATVTVAAAPTPPPTPPTDTTKPTATITSPSDFVTSNSSVIIRTVATDDVAISKVELRIVGGAVLGTDTTAPYDLVFDTTKVPNGNYSIVAVAYDTAGNTATSAPITVKVRLADVDRKNGVDIADLSGLISNWNQNNSAVSTNIAYDLNDDGVVGFADLTILISKWTVK